MALAKGGPEWMKLNDVLYSALYGPLYVMLLYGAWSLFRRIGNVEGVLAEMAVGLLAPLVFKTAPEVTQAPVGRLVIKWISLTTFLLAWIMAAGTHLFATMWIVMIAVVLVRGVYDAFDILRRKVD